MNVLRRALLLLVPASLIGGLLVTSPDVAHGAAAAQCRRTLHEFPELEPGDRRPAVRTLQCAINDLGLGPVEVDGYYGPQTRDAVKTFQSAQNSTATGRVDYATRYMLGGGEYW